MTHKRRQAYRRGHHAERLAAFSLQLRGYRIAARRYKTPVGEVDLIARRKDLVLFVEVKARSNHQAALDSIGRTAQQRIEAAAMWWLGQQADAGQLSWRFDVITVMPRRWPRHFKDVW
ncbi:MAG: YraN family protein [Rhizobiaceae bacterium]